PPTILPGGFGTSPMTDKEVTLFPQPDSPTIPNTSPSRIWKSTWSTAGISPLSVKKDVCKSLTSSIVFRFSIEPFLYTDYEILLLSIIFRISITFVLFGANYQKIINNVIDIIIRKVHKNAIFIGGTCNILIIQNLIKMVIFNHIGNA